MEQYLKNNSFCLSKCQINGYDYKTGSKFGIYPNEYRELINHMKYDENIIKYYNGGHNSQSGLYSFWMTDYGNVFVKVKNENRYISLEKIFVKNIMDDNDPNVYMIYYKCLSNPENLFQSYEKQFCEYDYPKNKLSYAKQCFFILYFEKWILNHYNIVLYNRTIDTELAKLFVNNINIL